MLPDLKLRTSGLSAGTFTCSLIWSSGHQPVCRRFFLLPDLELRTSGLSAGAFSCQASSPVPQHRPLEGSQSSIHLRSLYKVWPREQLLCFRPEFFLPGMFVKLILLFWKDVVWYIKHGASVYSAYCYKNHELSYCSYPQEECGQNVYFTCENGKM